MCLQFSDFKAGGFEPGTQFSDFVHESPLEELFIFGFILGKVLFHLE